MLRRLPIALVLLLHLRDPLPAQESPAPQLLAEEASGTVEVSGEELVSISGLTGSFTVYLGRPGRLSFESRPFDKAQGGPLDTAPPTVAVWLDGAGFRIAPAAGAEGRPVALTVLVPRDLAVTLDVNDSRVAISTLRGTLRVRGARLDVTIEEQTGSITLDLEGGKAKVARSAGNVSIRARDAEATVLALTGTISLDAAGGAFHAQDVNEIEAETQGGKVKVARVHGMIRLRANGGSVEAKELFLGGAFRMDDAPLVLSRCHGTLDVESDSEVRFEETETLHVGSAASVVGSRNSVALEVRTDNATVTLDSIGGTAVVSGGNLKLTLHHIDSSTKVNVSSSEVTADGVAGALEITCEDSTVKVMNASQDITIRSHGGDVEVLGQMGPAEVHADGERVLFEWGSLYPAKSSTITNDGGSVFMVFPAGSGLRVEAESRYGRIESEFPEIEVTSEGTKASGSLGRANQSMVVRVVAERDITLATRKQEE